jgi:hypothetical protein
MTYACASCGEDTDTFVDPSGGARQVYTEEESCRVGTEGDSPPLPDAHPARLTEPDEGTTWASPHAGGAYVNITRDRAKGVVTRRVLTAFARSRSLASWAKTSRVDELACVQLEQERSLPDPRPKESSGRGTPPGARAFQDFGFRGTGQWRGGMAWRALTDAQWKRIEPHHVANEATSRT